MSEPAEVVSVIRHEVRPGHESAYEAWFTEVHPVARAFEGHHGVAIVRPPEGSRTYTVVLHFDTLEHLKAWLESDVRQRLLERVRPHLVQPGEVEIRPGLDFWLSLPGQRHALPHRQFLLALSVVFPLSLVVPALLEPLFRRIPGGDLLVVRALLVSGLMVALMTWVVLPRYTRAVAGWLYGTSRTREHAAPGGPGRGV